jgi:predicted enzyme related to lactoylglutathione lyase
MAKLNYVELPATGVAAAKSFYTAAFGWEFTDYGPDYAAAEQGPATLALNGDSGEGRPAAPLPVIEVEDLEAVLAAVQLAGGQITVPVFSFPGGRRFHFRDPAGNELAATQPGEPE